MKNNLWFKLSGAALLGLLILGFAAPSGQTAPTVTLTAVVRDQFCSEPFVVVTLTATLNPPAQRVQFQWDFNNDGIFDTALSPNPTVHTVYGEDVTVTAVVRAVRGSRSATNSVTFTTLSCPRINQGFQFFKTVPLARRTRVHLGWIMAALESLA
jgi:hypothetical protein